MHKQKLRERKKNIQIYSPKTIKEAKARRNMRKRETLCANIATISISSSGAGGVCTCKVVKLSYSSTRRSLNAFDLSAVCKPVTAWTNFYLNWDFSYTKIKKRIKTKIVSIEKKGEKRRKKVLVRRRSAVKKTQKKVHKMFIFV